MGVRDGPPSRGKGGDRTAAPQERQSRCRLALLLPIVALLLPAGGWPPGGTWSMAANLLSTGGGQTQSVGMVGFVGLLLALPIFILISIPISKKTTREGQKQSHQSHHPHCAPCVMVRARWSDGSAWCPGGRCPPDAPRRRRGAAQVAPAAAPAAAASPAPRWNRVS